MIRRTFFRAAALTAILCFSSVAWAERPPESREDATHAIVGTVESVYSYEDKSNHYYVVKIVIETVERGTGFEPGDAFYAECFQRKKSAPRIPAPYGHKAVPKAEQRIRAFVIHVGPRSEGIYSDWFEVLKTE